METREWALILFTVLSQAVIGAFILIAWFRQRKHDEAMDAAYKKAVLVLLAVALVALLASLFHLGRPQLALTALQNLSASWLSREVFFSGGFFVLLVASVLLERYPAVRKVVVWLAALAGVLAVISMAAIYHMSMKPAWQGWGTYVAFIATVVLVGSATAAGLVVLFGQGNAQVAPDLQSLIYIAVASLAVGLVAYPLYLVSLAGSGTAQETLKLLAGPHGLTLLLRWAFTLVGGLLPLVLVWWRLAAGKTATGLVYTALVFLLAGELVGRYLFYATGVNITIG